MKHKSELVTVTTTGQYKYYLSKRERQIVTDGSDVGIYRDTIYDHINFITVSWLNAYFIDCTFFKCLIYRPIFYKVSFNNCRFIDCIFEDMNGSVYFEKCEYMNVGFLKCQLQGTGIDNLVTPQISLGNSCIRSDSAMFLQGSFSEIKEYKHNV